MEFNLDFSESLIKAAQSLIDKGNFSESDKRVIIYLSMLSCEISLKSFLEKAGVSVKEIKSFSHDLDRLLTEFGNYLIEKKNDDKKDWLSASNIRSLTVNNRYNNATVGNLLSELNGASKYPSELRYGEKIKHYPTLIMLNCASTVLQWVKIYSNSIRQKPPR